MQGQMLTHCLEKASPMQSRRVLIVPAAALAGIIAILLLLKQNTRRTSAAEQALGDILPEVSFVNTPLHEAAATLGKLSGARIAIDRQALEDAKVDPGTRVDLRLKNVSLDQALTQVLGYAASGKSVPLVYVLDGEGIVVTTAGGAGRQAYARVYDVSDIEVQVPEAVGEWNHSRGCFDTPPPEPEPAMSRIEQDEYILSLINGILVSDAPAGPTGEAAYALHGRLLVLAGSHFHRQVQELLDQLRHTAGPAGR